MEINVSTPLVASFMLLATILTYLKTVSINVQAGTLVHYDRLSANLHAHALMDLDSISFLLRPDILTNLNKVSLTLQSFILTSWGRVPFLLQADILTEYERKYYFIHVLHSIYSNNCIKIKKDNILKIYSSYMFRRKLPSSGKWLSKSNS